MPNISIVDYENIPNITRKMRGIGNELNSELLEIYTNISELHNSWYGKRYNELLKSFNSIIPVLHEMLDLVVTKIPDTLDTIANNYSLADTGARITTVLSENKKPIREMVLPEDVGMRFLTEEVTNIQQLVSNNFQNSVIKMENFEIEFNKNVWESEAAEIFKQRFIKLKNEITTSFEELKQQYSVLMNQALDDMKQTEDANTVE